MLFQKSGPTRSRKGKKRKRRAKVPDLRALETRLAANGNVFDDLVGDDFSVVGSSDGSELEHGLTDDSDTDDVEDKHDEGGWFNFDDLDDAEFMADESGDNQPREVAKCSNAVDHSRVTLPRPASRMPACLATVHPVFVCRRKESPARVVGLALTT